MCIQHHEVVSPGFLEHVGEQLGRDRGPEAGLLVALAVGEVRGDDGDGLGRGEAARVDDQQELHHGIV